MASKPTELANLPRSIRGLRCRAAQPGTLPVGRKRPQPATLRAALGVVTVLALVLTGAVTPAEASAAERARTLPEATLAEVTAAASGTNSDDPQGTSAPADEEVASATLRAGDGTTVAADAVDTAVTFGGKKSDTELSVTVSRMPVGTAASAASETAGVIASAPVRVTAHDDTGAEITTIEAQVTTEATSASAHPQGPVAASPDANAPANASAPAPASSSSEQVSRAEPGRRSNDPDARRETLGDSAPGTIFPGTNSADTDAGGPQGVTHVKPGVTIAMGVDPAILPTLDPASLQIFTRENAGDPWLPLASHYDSATQTVIGESGHLSQFVVIGKPYVAPVGPVVVLDPDDGVAHTDSPAKVDSELPYNIALANGVKTLLQNACLATVKLTREDPATPYVDAQTRADFAAAQNPSLTATLAFDAPVGHAWGVTAASGGSKVFSNGLADSDAVGDYLNNTLPSYTTRSSKSWAPIPAQNIPQKEFEPNPGTYIHLEALNLDNNCDWPIIDQHMDEIAAGVAESFRQYLISKGYNCLSPAAAGFPSPPTAAAKAAWADLGKQNYQLYGSEPVSFSTGNLIEEEPILTLPGNGGSSIDLGLTYNAQDGRLTRSGAGWSLGVGAHAQVFNDASVMIVRGDGASYTFTPNKAGGYDGDPSMHKTLTNAAGKLTLTGADGQTWTFDATDAEGIGELSSYRNLAGNGYDVAYGTPSPTAQFLPIASITDTGGQVIRATSDAEGRTTSFTAPDARAWGFAYDAAGNLTAITYPGGGGGRHIAPHLHLRRRPPSPHRDGSARRHLPAQHLRRRGPRREAARCAEQHPHLRLRHHTRRRHDHLHRQRGPSQHLHVRRAAPRHFCHERRRRHKEVRLRRRETTSPPTPTRPATGTRTPTMRAEMSRRSWLRMPPPSSTRTPRRVASRVSPTRAARADRRKPRPTTSTRAGS